jgi:hypothetical protein
MVEPQFRANYTKLTLKALRVLPERQRQSVLDRIGIDTVILIRGAGILDWLPAELHVRLLSALHATLGSSGACRFWRELMVMSLNRALLRPLIEGGLGLFGRAPRSLLRMAPQAHSLVTRGCGRIVTCDLDERTVRLSYVELPSVLATGPYAEQGQGSCEAVLDYLELRGTVMPRLEQLTRGTIAFDVQHHQPGGQR